MSTRAGRRRTGDAPIARAVGVKEEESSRHATLHDELTARACPMVRAAQRDQVIGLVTAAASTGHNMVNVDPRGVATPRHLAALLVA